jgi:glycerophosphoryl diester phosphodiesterase
MRPLVIAHRGASGYLPEHTLASKRLAHQMGADFLEQDVVATRDDELVVLHDIHLDRVPDVAERFPGRARDDGRFYARDFDLEELRTLQAWERMNADGSPVYPGRYPARSGDFSLHTLGEEIEFIQRLNAETGRVAGIYPEIKRPAWHREEGVDIAPLMLGILADAGFDGPDDPVFVQCFDDAELRRLRHELDCPYKLVQLIGANNWNEADTDYDVMRTRQGLEKLARTVDAVGPWLLYLYELRAGDDLPVSTGFVGMAHEVGLGVHPFTFRADDLPRGFEKLAELVRFFADELAIDGLFTDFPDLILEAIGVGAAEAPEREE